VDQAIEFVDTDFDEAPTTVPGDTRRVYSGASIHELLIASLTDPPQVLRRSIGVRLMLPRDWRPNGFKPRFPRIASSKRRGNGDPAIRDDREHLLSRAWCLSSRTRVSRFGDKAPVAIALCLRHENETGIDLDAILIGETDLAILFSFTRAYFRVDTECPYELVRSLRELMPRKRLIDLYNAVGYHRHGKTEFYRDFVRHLRNSNDRFVAAEGARGMVMLVFTLPSYDVVFKLIKDHFDYPKESTRAEVMRRYRLVFEHDRAGRLVEAHEFEHLRIARDRFDPALLEDLLRDTVRLCGSKATTS
jgi:hypothetical protein